MRFLAQGSYQQSVGQDHFIAMSESSVSMAISEILPVLESVLCPKHIKFEMTSAEKSKSKSFFYQKNGFPDVTMVVDGTLIEIIRPNQNEEQFYSRTGYHGINAMVVSYSNLNPNSDLVRSDTYQYFLGTYIASLYIIVKIY